MHTFERCEKQKLNLFQTFKMNSLWLIAVSKWKLTLKSSTNSFHKWTLFPTNSTGIFLTYIHYSIIPPLLVSMTQVNSLVLLLCPLCCMQINIDWFMFIYLNETFLCNYSKEDGKIPFRQNLVNCVMKKGGNSKVHLFCRNSQWDFATGRCTYLLLCCATCLPKNSSTSKRFYFWLCVCLYVLTTQKAKTIFILKRIQPYTSTYRYIISIYIGKYVLCYYVIL